MADSMERCKMLWGRPLLPWQATKFGLGAEIQSPTGLTSLSVCLSASGLFVYVSVTVDLSVSSQRRHVYHASAMTFNDARQECVANNGDLPNIENNRDLDDVITNITANANTNTETNGTRLHTFSCLTACFYYSHL